VCFNINRLPPLPPSQDITAKVKNTDKNPLKFSVLAKKIMTAIWTTGNKSRGNSLKNYHITTAINVSARLHIVGVLHVSHTSQ